MSVQKHLEEYLRLDSTARENPSTLFKSVLPTLKLRQVTAQKLKQAKDAASIQALQSLIEYCNGFINMVLLTDGKCHTWESQELSQEFVDRMIPTLRDKYMDRMKDINRQLEDLQIGKDYGKKQW